MRKRVIYQQDRTRLNDPGGAGVVTQCTRAGNFVYIAGQGGLSLDDRLIGAGDPARQARQACENIKTLVEMAGGSLADVVKIVVYVTDRAHQPATYRAIRQLFPGVWPCRTAYVVPGLARAELLIEIDAWAFIDDDKTKKQLLRSQQLSGADGGMAQGYRAGNLVYLQGQGGSTLDGLPVGRADPAAQAHAAMENLKALMELAGGSLGDVVRIVMGVTKREDRTVAYPVVRSYWPGVPPPGTGLIADGLASDDVMFQIDAWGFVDTPSVRKRVIRTHDVGIAGMPGSTGRAGQCVRAGNWVFLQGQVGWTLEGELVAIGDPAGQARQAMENIKALMELAGGSLSDVVRMVIYVTDRAAHTAVDPIIRDFYGGARPCGTGIVVKGLARPEMQVEIDAYGFIDDPE